ncbi:UDP-glucuronosyltransferase 2B20-like, partial [Saccoglossus kowalevskii]
ETKAFIQDTNILERLNAANFDLILANAFNPGFALIVDTWRVPFISVSTMRALPMIDDLLHGLPSNPAYVPAVKTGYSDEMTFPQRLGNTFAYLASAAMFEFLLLKPFKSIQQRHNIRPELSYRSLCRNSELVLFCSDFAFDYPRPMMPHAIYIGSLTARTPDPLSQEWTEFVESAVEGIVVFTLGSQANIGEDLEKATKFVKAFARLPQKVIMKYEGNPPNGLGENTKLSSWIPQNDLLGHPNTKAFISHGGINGVNEAIYHAVPFIGMALSAEQSENVERLVNKEMAISLDSKSFTEDDVYNAVKKAIEDPRYKDNAARLSSIQRDTPMPPGDTAVYWVEHILKFGGDHLKPASLELNLVQYLLLDIAVFLLI